jgi:hypothetical protein
MTTKNSRNIIPENNLIEVKLAASITSSVNAIRHRTEFSANAKRASTVNKANLSMTTHKYNTAHS